MCLAPFCRKKGEMLHFEMAHTKSPRTRSRVKELQWIVRFIVLFFCNNQNMDTKQRGRNMESSYLAHISDQGETQSVLEHLRGTAALAQSFARPFGGDEQAFLAGMTHDIGKYSQAFQKHLHGAPIRVEHSTAGAVECWQRRQILAAFAVAGHHGGLPDGGSQTDSGDRQ